MQLSSFKAYVLLDFKRTDKDTELVQAYNDMIIWVASYMPHGGYKFQSYIQLIAGQEDYPVPSRLLHLMHPVRIQDGSEPADAGYILNHVTKQEYDILYPNPNRITPDMTGRPEDYTVYSRSILVGPIPAAGTNDLLEIDWSKRPLTLSGDTEVSELGTEWDEILKFGTLERLMDGIERHEEALYWAAKYKNSEGSPVGMCRRLFDIEKAREGAAIGQVQANTL